jgi:FlaA1/EpsC-like NDP-sugar epimerase
MKSATVYDIARAIAKRDFATMVIGMRPGEKIHEDIECFASGFTRNSFNAEKFTLEELTALVSEAL